MRKNHVSKQCNQGGWTLVELGIVLLIVAIISAIGLFAYSKINNRLVAGEEADIVLDYIANTKRHYRDDVDYSTVSTPTLVSLQIIPTANKYQGTVTVAPNTITTANDSAAFTNTNYSQFGCLEVVPRVASNTRSITVNGTVVKQADIPYDKAALGNACTVAANTVAYIVSR